MESIKKYASSNVQIILVGNKCDLEHKIVVSQKMIEKYIEEHKLKYSTTSAKKNINIVELFTTISKIYLDDILTREFELNDASNKKNNVDIKKISIDITSNSCQTKCCF